MTNEKILELINKAIGNLKDNDDMYGQTPIDFMRKNGIKSTANMSFFLDSVGAYLEEIRCGVLADIEASAAKKNGKASVLSAVKKIAKEIHKTCINTKPYLAYAHYDETDNVYWMCGQHFMFVTESPDGLELCPEAIEKNMGKPMDYRKYLPDVYNMKKCDLPPIGKLTAYLKQAKATALKGRHWERIFFNDFGVNGLYLEMFMRLTGADCIYYKNSTSVMYMEGNGYKCAICPIQNRKDDGTMETPTDFGEE